MYHLPHAFLAPSSKYLKSGNYIAFARKFLAKHDRVLHRKTGSFSHSGWVGMGGITDHHYSPAARGFELHQLCRTEMELFVSPKCSQCFSHDSGELFISSTETLKPALDWIIHRLCRGEMSKDVGLIAANGNESYHAAVTNEYKHVVRRTEAAHHSPPVHIAAVRGQCL